MTTKTPTADPGAPAETLALPAGFPSEAEINRWANAFFAASPGGSVPSVPANPGPETAVMSPQSATVVPTIGALPVSAGGIGLSAPQVALAPLPFSPLNAGDFAVPDLSGVGLATPAGAPSVTGGGLSAPPSLAGIGAGPSPASLHQGDLSRFLSPEQSSGSAPIPSSELYIFSEARPRDAFTPQNQSATDWLTPRADLMPGLEDLEGLLKDTGSQEHAAEPRPSQIRQDDVPAQIPGGYPAYDVEAIRRDFPILRERIHGRPLIWLDNGATTQKPQAVIDRLAYFYAHENSNVHRGAHTLAARATDAYENARKTVARFIGAVSADEIVFVRGATEAINLVAQAWGRQNVSAGDEIIVSHLEHHANIVPWQQLAREKGAHLRVIPVGDNGQILLDAYDRLLSDRTRIVAVTHVSNALGTVVPIKTIVERAHAHGAKVLIDGAQSVAHARVDMRGLDADFFVFSGHKIFAPTGIGVLYGKRDILNAMPPWQGGGNMIADVTFEETVYQPAPARFEAGTGNLADAAGLAAALEYLEQIGLENIARHEHDLLEYATAGLKTISGLKLFGTAPDKVSVLSFLIEGFAPEEIGTALDRYGIAVRAGHHCAQPILRRLGVEGTVRASLALYNTFDEIDCFIQALRQIAASRGRGRA